MKITKEMILKNYNKELYNNGYELNKAMCYTDFNKKEGCRYYLYPTYIDITDYFTAEEMANNFYLGDILILDFKKFPESDPKKFFGPDWTEEYGIINKWQINVKN